MHVSAPLGGCNTHHIYQTDYFFARFAAQPEEDVVLDDGDMRRAGTEIGRANPLEPRREPKEQARFVYAQFADGSTIGDANAAKELLETRAAMFETFRKLNTAYVSGGVEAFGTVVNQKAANGNVESQLKYLRKSAKMNGMTAVVTEIQTKLRNAEANQAHISTSRSRVSEPAH